jgi:hypothetical protein
MASRHFKLAQTRLGGLSRDGLAESEAVVRKDISRVRS